MQFPPSLQECQGKMKGDWGRSWVGSGEPRRGWQTRWGGQPRQEASCRSPEPRRQDLRLEEWGWGAVELDTPKPSSFHWPCDLHCVCFVLYQSGNFHWGKRLAGVGAKIAWGLGKLTRAAGESQWPGAGGPRGCGKFHSTAASVRGHRSSQGVGRGRVVRLLGGLILNQAGRIK